MGPAVVTIQSSNGPDDPGEFHDPDSDPDCASECGDSFAYVDVTFTAPLTVSSANPGRIGLWFAAHLAASFDPNPGPALPDGWGPGRGASDASGASFHVIYDSGGARDNQLQAGVVEPPGAIKIVKNTVGGNDTFSFTCTGTGGNPAPDPGCQSAFNITTTGTPTSGTGNTQFDGLLAGTYVVSELW